MDKEYKIVETYSVEIERTFVVQANSVDKAIESIMDGDECPIDEREGGTTKSQFEIKSIKMLDTAKSLEDELWAEVESLGWAKDHDYRRIREEIEYKFTVSEITRLTDFVDNMQDKLMRKYYNDWLGDPGIDVSDDGWSDLTAEVVGRGKDFYENITLEKLQEMANNDDYRENFRYCFHN
jgi:hypothetical protein